VTSAAFITRWQHAGGAERANYSLFLTELCDLLGVPHPDATTQNPAHDAYVFERTVMFDNGPGTKASTGRIDLYKRNCFVLETKQGVGSFAPFLRDENADIKHNNIAHDPRTTRARPAHDPRTTRARPAHDPAKLGLMLNAQS
jgi:hypothetical protein